MYEAIALVIQHLPDYVSAASVILLVLTAIVVTVQAARQEKEVKLDDLLAKALAGSTFPTAIVLIACAFDPSLLAGLRGLNVHIAAAGLALFYLSYRKLTG